MVDATVSRRHSTMNSLRYVTRLEQTVQGNVRPSLRNMLQRAIKGRPSRAVGSAPSSACIREIPKRSHLKAPAQSNGKSAAT